LGIRINIQPILHQSGGFISLTTAALKMHGDIYFYELSPFSVHVASFELKERNTPINLQSQHWNFG
jgi:hypothetical protein